MTSVVLEAFKRTCRTCLTTDGEMISIFSGGLYVENLPKKLMAFTEVEMAEHDGLPDTICKKCVFLADSFYCFKEQCESADNKLKSMIMGEHKEKSNKFRRRKKLDSESSHKSSKTATSLITSSNQMKYTTSGKRTPTRGYREQSYSESVQESEDEYIVEYISDDVRIEVENALKRKREAERRISMEKLSQSIKNLEGIEVVPISNGRTAPNFRTNLMQKEEIVVFPVKQLKKIGHTFARKVDMTEERSVLKPNMLEVDNTEDSPLQHKKFKLDLSSVKVDSAETMKKDSQVVYGKNKKLHFSTVRKVVKIDDEALFVDLKEEDTINPSNDNSQIENQEIIVIDDNSYGKIEDENDTVQGTHNQDMKISHLQEGQTTNSESREMQIYHLQSDLEQVGQCLGVQILKFQDGERIIELHEAQPILESRNEQNQLQRQNVQNDEEDGISQDVIIIDSEGEPEEEKFYFHPDMAEDDVEVLAQEFQQIQSRRISESLSNNTIVSESTIGCIISGTDESNIDNDNDVNEAAGIATSFQDTGDDTETLITYTADKSNEIFIENEISSHVNVNSSDIDKTEGAITVESSKMDTSEIQGEEITENETQTGQQKARTSMNIESSEDVTPLAPVELNISDERKQEVNQQIYKNEINAEEEVHDNSTAKIEPPISNSQERSFGTNMKFYQCTICKVNFATMPSVLKHNIQEHMTEESIYSCLICEKTFEDKPSLCLHVEEHNGLRPYRCTFCPKTYTLKRNLKRHVNHHINYKPYQCHICMKRFTEKSSLRSHMYLHTGDSPFSCKTCNVSFNNKANWRRHVITIHEKLTVIVCKYCNKELPDKRSLQTHIRTHTGDRPYQCPHCDKRFSQQCNLNTHIHCHLNDRPFLCPHCGKGFNQRGTRDDHVLTHTGEKPHKCTECSASFTVSSALKRHMWIHTNKDRPYNCHKCRLQFVGLYDLRRHLKVRHGEIVRPENPRVERVNMIEPLKHKVERSQSEENAESSVSITKTELDECGTTIGMMGQNQFENNVDNAENVAKPKLDDCEIETEEQEGGSKDYDQDSKEIDIKLSNKAMKTEENV